jgi:hypothetical protein
MLRKWTKLGFAALVLLGLVACAATTRAQERQQGTAETSVTQDAMAQRWYVWYRFPGERWHIRGPYSRLSDANDVASDYERQGAQTDVKNHS